MLSKEENELLCHVGSGTPMGNLMRQYWLPAATSPELPSPDCPPLRVRLLGENLIGFRTTSGKVGLMQDACPHRGASMFFGRNEEEGLRCVYHGWKFDCAGQCTDMPSEPAESNFKTKVKATAYPCAERNGVIWAYMGPRETPPPLPEIESNLLPEGQWSVSAILRECNYMQALEGDIDTAHLGFLHLGSLKPEDVPARSFNYYTVNDRAPRYSVIDTDFGTSYGAYRPAETDSYYWRIAHFLFPCYTMIPTGVIGVQVLIRAWVPMDDDHTMYFSITGRGARPATNRQGGAALQRTDGQPVAGTGQTQYRPNATDWFGRWRLTANEKNDYLIDREAQSKDLSYTGIDGIFLQDQAVTESMGPIYDRTQEQLGTSDSMVVRTRLRLINAAKALRDQGATPPGVDNPKVYLTRSGGVILPRSVDWVEATQELRKAFVSHPDLTEAPLRVPAR